MEYTGSIFKYNCMDGALLPNKPSDVAEMGIKNKLP
jgi:hypothetical protein